MISMMKVGLSVYTRTGTGAEAYACCILGGSFNSAVTQNVI